MTTIPIRDITMHYEEQGDGDPLMLIAGLEGTGAPWAPYVPLFAKRFRTIVADQRGTGRTSQPATGYTIPEHAHDMAELLRTLRATPAHLVGTSAGGAIAMTMAADHPDTVRSLCLVSTWGRTDPYFSELCGLRRQILEKAGPEVFIDHTMLLLHSPAFLRQHWTRLRPLVQQLKGRPANSAIQAARLDMLIGHDILDRLNRVQLPTAIIVGELDTVTPPYLSQELHDHLPQADLHIIEQAGHAVLAERPEEFFSILVRFFDRQAGGA